ncbi:MAG: endonuclease MutS2 [Oscillospiraceae bacterium]
MSLFEKSLRIIELPAVLELLAKEAVSDPGKESAGKLFPSPDIYEVRRRLSETTAAKTMMTTRGSPAFSGVRDVGAPLSRADLGGMLSTRELLNIAGVLRSAREALSYASGDRQARTDIDYLFSSLRANKYLEEKITTSIPGEDEIADAASPELTSIRRGMRLAGDRARRSLQKIISSQSYAKALQEPIITMRNDRYVVPVKAEHKSSVPGLVHDISSSGATLFIEPMSAVEANNEIRELLVKEKAEIDRILMALSAEAAADAEDITCDFNVLVQLDLIFAKAKLSYRLNAGEPALSENGELILRHARHPLLPQKTAVPIDVRLGGEFDTLVITGPNTGGKTVTLKTLGLLSVMAQCGLHIPADDGSAVPVYRKVLADIGDEQSIEQSLSTFSSHMTNIVKILAECGEDTLLLFDELGAGTDPTEGAALAISIIEYARNLGAKIAATTHYSELKFYATSNPGVQNASCEFDIETLRPTYKLLIGIPGKSNAFAISRRLGLPDKIIDDAVSRIDSDSASFEEVLENLEKTRQEMEREKVETRKLRQSAEEDAKESEKNRDEIRREREKAVRLAKREADRIIEEARHAAEEVFDELGAMRKRAEKENDWQRVNDARADIRRRLNEAEDSLNPDEGEKAPPPMTRPAAPGDTVLILSIGTKAEVVSVNTDGSLNLQAGIMKVTAKQEEVRISENAEDKQTQKVRRSVETQMRAVTAKPEVDVRGLTAEEAIPIVERFIDSARMGKLTTVTVIHGKGTGALRAAVQKNLKSNPMVKTYRLGRYGEGETGVTVIELK